MKPCKKESRNYVINKKALTLLTHVASSCSECGRCAEGCLFLSELSLTPKEFAISIRDDKHYDNLRVFYSCNSCGWCREICPEKIDLGLLFQYLKEERKENGLALPPACRLVEEGYEWVKRNQYIALEPFFDTDEKGKSIFFPGCALSGYSAFLVLKIYEYLTKKRLASGIILACCGSPLEAIGDRKAFRESLRNLGTQLEQIGASHLITACPTCHRVFRSCFPGYSLTSVYEIFDKEGLPETGVGGYGNHDFFLFHSCAARDEKEMRHAAQKLMIKMGCLVEEDDTETALKCCGMGGMVGVTNPFLALNIAHELTESISSDIVVTYCAMCREALAQHKPAMHILDLMFNLEWILKKDEPPCEENQRRENFIFLKSHLAGHRVNALAS